MTGTRASIIYPPGKRPRIVLDWVAGRGKPGINADVQSSTESARAIADEDMELTGSNVLSADSSFNTATASIRLLNGTAGADDSVIIGGHEDANQSGWGVFTWGVDQEIEWECLVTLGTAALLVDSIYFAGLKLTNANALATDADQAYFRISDDNEGAGAWQAATSVSNVDEIVDTAVVAPPKTLWHMRIAFDENWVCRMYLNDQLVLTQSFHETNAVDLLPFVGVVEDTSATVPRFFVHRMCISRALDL